MNPIRPQTPFPPQTPAPAQSGRTAAQRAFFQAAMGEAPAKAAAAPAEPAREAVRVQTVRAETPAEPPTKILRPGSLLDIRV
ncbi:hypothetical protein [Phenylobacterium sp.]|uniref:hypothetical protein n=1 Tax=Phenylobacterium sp. TaxID=1871053 RepID=UPI001996EBED|nr:hypothetical protein [Phenylobacterium sp.]MBC7167790.1 hypothetical protein [Phenylobacterium sp.]